MNYPMHLSHQEIERYAFLAGDGLVASLAETAPDLEQENLTLTSSEDTLKAQAFEAGKLDGLGEDVQAIIPAMSDQVANLTKQLADATGLIGICHARLQGNQSKPLKGRREAAHSLASRMVSHGLGHPRH